MTFPRGEEGLHAPLQPVVGQRRLGTIVRCENQKFAILNPGGDGVNVTDPNPTPALEHSLLTHSQTGKDTVAPLAVLA